MKVLLNDCLFSHAVQRGVSRYFRKITDGMIAHFGSDTIVCSSEKRDYRTAKYFRKIPIGFRGSYRLGLPKVNEWLVERVIQCEQPAVLFSPYFGKVYEGIPHVFTVYDMIFEMFPEYYGGNEYKWLIDQKRKCLEDATLLFAISHSAARDIVACYPHIDASKIIVTHLGVDEFFFQPNPDKAVRPGKPYFLFVGNRNLYKNFMRLLTAYAQSGLVSQLDLQVISPIGGGFTNEETQAIKRYGIEDNVLLEVGVSELELRKRYAGAVACVYPSEYEGFGLPILEAMASGTVVATSNQSSMPEIGDQAAFYFDPRDVNSIAACLNQVSGLVSNERAERIALGVLHARTFTWARCQQQTLNAFLKLENSKILC